MDDHRFIIQGFLFIWIADIKSSRVEQYNRMLYLIRQMNYIELSAANIQMIPLQTEPEMIGIYVTINCV